MSDCRCHSHGGFLLSHSLEGLAQRDPEGPELAGVVATRYLDRVVSMSALIEPPEPLFVDEILDQQYQRFHNGS